MVNCNPETVSTDYDTSDRLYFEPLTVEDVLEVVHAEQASGTVAGVIVAARRADPARSWPQALERRACRSSAPRRRPSTSPRTAARSASCCARPGCPRPPYGMATSFERGPRRSPTRIGYPVLVRPSYVLGGRGHGDRLRRDDAGRLHRPRHRDHPGRTRCWSTGSSTTPSRSTSTRCATATEVYLGGVMEHIEEAGVHSGDSACALPPITLGRSDSTTVRRVHRGHRARAAGCAGC